MKAVDSEKAAGLVRAARRLTEQVEKLRFAPPVTHVYNPLTYAWPAYVAYVQKYAGTTKRVVFLGMNPGPFGMVQTGVPFGEVTAVRNWLKLDAQIGHPPREHPRRPVLGFGCTRSEVSGRRLWGLFAERYGTAARFFTDHLVMNYCPLAFLEQSGCNRTPDKLPAAEREALFAACDAHLRVVLALLQPKWLIGVGDFAYKRAQQSLNGGSVKLARILHPSPASPAANLGWPAAATRQLEIAGVWSPNARRPNPTSRIR